MSQASVPPTNRRSSRRRPPRQTVKVECRKGTLGLGANLAADFRDLSEGGVCVLLKSALTANQEVEVLIHGYGVHTIKRLGRVRWAQTLEDGRVLAGVHFQSRLSFADVQNLAKP